VIEEIHDQVFRFAEHVRHEKAVDPVTELGFQLDQPVGTPVQVQVVKRRIRQTTDHLRGDSLK